MATEVTGQGQDAFVSINALTKVSALGASALVVQNDHLNVTALGVDSFSVPADKTRVSSIGIEAFVAPIVPNLKSIVTTVDFDLDVVIGQNPDDPYGGPVCCIVQEVKSILQVDGDSAHLIARTLSLPGSGVDIISVRNDDDVFGTTALITELWVLILSAPETNTADVIVRPGSSSGFTTLLGGEIRVRPGTMIWFRGDTISFWDASPGIHELEFENDGASVNEITVCLAGARLDV